MYSAINSALEIFFFFLDENYLEKFLHIVYGLLKVVSLEFCLHSSHRKLVTIRTGNLDVLCNFNSVLETVFLIKTV